jgi:hypothetical protein
MQPQSISISGTDKARLAVTGILGFGVVRFLGGGAVLDLNQQCGG